MNTAASHQQSFVANPLLPLFVAFAAGIFVSRGISPQLSQLVVSAGFLTVLSFLFVLSNRSRIATLFLSVAFLVLGMCFSKAERQTDLSLLLKSGQITDS